MTHKCRSIDCPSTVDDNSIWCEKCLDELGELFEDYRIGGTHSTKDLSEIDKDEPNIGDTVLIRAKVVDLSDNPREVAVKLEVNGFIDEVDEVLKGPIRFWIHRTVQPYTVVKE